MVCLLAPVAAPPQEPALRGYSTAGSHLEREWENKFRAIPDANRLREYMRAITRQPHHAGSPAGKAVAEYILARFQEWGLQAELEEFQVLLPFPLERSVELLAPTHFKAELKEPPVPQDGNSSDAGQLPTFNAYAADGDVTAPLVYVNYGVPDDYEQLSKLGVDVKGKIVMARYGGSWRGIKPKVAAEHGAAACLIYSDPRDDGYFQGDVFPEGAFRPPLGVQRGSVMDLPVYPGDPLTPGWAAVKDARRLPLSQAATLMKIPVLPISYADAAPLLKSLRGPVAPEPWRGALPFTYHVGPGPGTVRVKTRFDWSVRPIYDVVARIPGAAFPDEWVLYGNHHDAWVNGADDPTSGAATLMETARGLAELGKQGWRPKRTIVIAAWDGEEWGLLGSTEWAERHAAELDRKAVMYINSDTTGKSILNLGGSHSLEKFVNEVARDVPDPNTGKSVWEMAQERRLKNAKSEEERERVRKAPELEISALGSGSDYTPFVQHLGVASLNLGFGGDGGGGVYHSIYDSFYWYTHFSDANFVYGRTLAQVMGTALMRMANAGVLPFGFTNLAEMVARYETEVETLAGKQDAAKPEQKLDFAPLKDAVARLKTSGEAYEAALAARLPADPAEVNRLLIGTERAMTTPAGLPRREWYRHQLYAPGYYTGYAVKTLPGVREAIETKNWNEARAQMQVLTEVLGAVAKQIDAATAALKQ